MRNLVKVQARIDANLRDGFTEVLDLIGQTPTSGVRGFIRQAILENRIPFEPVPFPKEELGGKEVIMTVRVPEDEHAAFLEILAATGISQSKAVNMLAAATVHEGTLPFVLGIRGGRPEMCRQQLRPGDIE